MSAEVPVVCPYCYEHLELWLEHDERGRSVRDCDVCCRPWDVFVEWHDGTPSVTVTRAQ